jgi:hypothetical protein
MTDYDTLYPELPKDNSGDGENFRLRKVNEVMSKLESEVKHYENVRKKYAKTRGIFHKTAVISGIFSVLFTGSGVTTTLTGPGAIVGIPLSCVGGILGLISSSCTIITKKLTKKVAKHENTIQLGRAKQNSIYDLVSKALSDNKIDEKEFELIMGELQKYQTLKSDIRSARNNEFLKKTPDLDIKKIREELRKEIVDQLINQKK